MLISVGVGLEEDASRGVFRGVSGNGKGTEEIREMEDRLGQEEFLEVTEDSLAGGGPGPRTILLVRSRKG